MTLLRSVLWGMESGDNPALPGSDHVLSVHLESGHCRPACWGETEQALPIVEQQAFDLVLTDAVMPGMSGAALVEHLHATHPELRVILMSGYSRGLVDASSIASSRQQLRKPFTTAELMRAIRTALEQPSDKESLSEELTKLSGS